MQECRFEDREAGVNPNGTPSVSVIIPTKNRLDDLTKDGRDYSAAQPVDSKWSRQQRNLIWRHLDEPD